MCSVYVQRQEMEVSVPRLLVRGSSAPPLDSCFAAFCLRLTLPSILVLRIPYLVDRVLHPSSAHNSTSILFLIVPIRISIDSLANATQASVRSIAELEITDVRTPRHCARDAKGGKAFVRRMYLARRGGVDGLMVTEGIAEREAG